MKRINNLTCNNFNYKILYSENKGGEDGIFKRDKGQKEEWESI